MLEEDSNLLSEYPRKYTQMFMSQTRKLCKMTRGEKIARKHRVWKEGRNERRKGGSKEGRKEGREGGSKGEGKKE